MSVVDKDALQSLAGLTEESWAADHQGSGKTAELDIICKAASDLLLALSRD